MNRRPFTTLAATLTVLALVGPAVAEPNTLTEQQKEQGWQALFNGKNLEGWSVRSGEATYRVADDAIIGKTVKGSPNTFLTTEDQFEDFVLKFQVKLDDNQLNSGVQLRSSLRGDSYGGRLYGPQVEIEAAPGESGYIYGEAMGTGWLSEDRSAHQEAFKNQTWNQYRVRAVDGRIQTWLNGQKIEDLQLSDEHAEQFSEGRVGLQVHGVGDSGPFQVRWRNIYLKPVN
jgi:hypothetical protein